VSGVALRIDANIILRYLRDEQTDHGERAARLFAAVAAGALSVTLEDVVVAEVAWTLASFYRLPKQEIATILLTLLAEDGIHNPDKETLQLALALFAQWNLDFADALLAAKAFASGDNALYSYDRDFDRIPGLHRQEPG
jgi:predicted nucleic acid-binding protein